MTTLSGVERNYRTNPDFSVISQTKQNAFGENIL